MTNVLPSQLRKAESAAESTLLYRLGGEDGLELTVIHFYELIMKDPALQPFFADVDMASLTAHQQRFMTLAFTKIPDDFDVFSFIVRRHNRLFDDGLSEQHFDMVAGHLVAALKDMMVEPDVIDDVVALLGPLREAFVKEGREAKVAAAELKRIEEHRALLKGLHGGDRKNGKNSSGATSKTKSSSSSKSKRNVAKGTARKPATSDVPSKKPKKQSFISRFFKKVSMRNQHQPLFATERTEKVEF